MSNAAKILLIEDDAGIRDTLRRALAEEGHEVAVEKRGDEGLARAGKDAFNLVITDLRMPGLGGLDLVRQLHAAQPRLPIILITAYGTTEKAIEATKFGASDYVRARGARGHGPDAGCAGGPERGDAGHLQGGWTRCFQACQCAHSRRDRH